MTTVKKKTIRCAIYTRKSCEEGLEQDFNSLDAQREACESYIKSQQHEGWVTVEKQYNDGGFSGGNLERPALKQLFEDIEAGNVDTVVVYKIDRLTRSLMDFSKIVELFDKHSVTFVSITQQFNTTTSMGRLTLNILLSFAQFEREVTAERIRDKKAASAKKGMWTSGKAPIGYELKDKKLIINEERAKTVRIIFDKYLEFQAIKPLKEYLDTNGLKTVNDKYFSKGNLYHILNNKIYLGLIIHKDNVYNGEHEAIIDNETFDRAQALLSKNRVYHKCYEKSKNPSLLAGKLFDDTGNYMSPSHSNKNNRNYRYYVSQAILQFRRNEADALSKIPAGEIEKFVVDEIGNFIFGRHNIQKYIENFDVHKQKDILEALNNLKINVKDKLDNTLVRIILNKVILYKEKVDIIICQNQIINTLEAVTYGTPLPEEKKGEVENPIIITKTVQIMQVNFKGGIIIVSEHNQPDNNVNPQLVKALAKSHYWNHILYTGEAKNSIDIQKMEGLKDNTYVQDILRLKFLASDITEAILNGTQPLDLSIQKLFTIRTLDWREQRKLLF